MNDDIESYIDTLSEGEQELYILAEELATVNFFIIRYADLAFIGTYRNKEQMKEVLLADEEKKKYFWPSIFEVPKTNIQDTLDEFGKVYCPELRADYTNIIELLRDLKIFSLASLIE